MKRRLSTRNLVLVIVALAILVVVLIYSLFSLLGINFPATNPLIVTFDFDTGSPFLIEGQNTPLNQTTNGLTAQFSSPSDPTNPAFSVQSYDTTFMQLPQFSGRWLYDNKPTVDVLDIFFSHELAGINFMFVTLEYHGGSTVQPTEIKLTAYMNSTDTSPVGSVTARGAFSTGLYPQGTLSFTSDIQPFNLVRIQIPYVPQGATDFFVDNIIVTKAQ